MCPLCIANITVLATTSSGGVVAVALKTFRSRRQPKETRQRNENKRAGIRPRSGVSAGVGGCAATTFSERERVDARPRRPGSRAAADAVAARREGLHV